MATAAKVHGSPLTTAVSRVLACLLEKDVEFQLVNDMVRKHKKPDDLKSQDLIQQPLFCDADIALSEILEPRAFCRYVCDKYANCGNKELYGTNPLAKASIEKRLKAEERRFNPPSWALVYQLVFTPTMKIKQELIKQSEEKLAKVLDVYEKRLGESRFLAGDEFTLADLSHLPNTQYLVNWTEKGEMFTSRKNVGRWWGEISSRDSWKKVVAMQNAEFIAS